MRRRTAVVVTGVAIAVLVLYQVALAVTGAQGPPITPASRSELVAGQSKGIKVIRQFTPSLTSAATYQNFIQDDINIAPFEQVLLVFTFSAESACYANNPDAVAAGWCRVKILVDGLETAPFEGNPHSAAFDSTDATAGGVPHDDQSEGPDSYESHSIQRSICYQNLQEATVPLSFKVQWRTTDPGVSFWLDDVHLTVEKYAATTSTCKEAPPT